MALDFRSLVNAFRSSARVFNRIRQDARAPAGSGRRLPAPADAKPGPPRPAAEMGLADGYPGDFRGAATVIYDPHPDGAPDPGEVVWAWVPYEEDHTRGKDRPVLLVGRSGPYLLGLMLTSRDRVPASGASGDYVDLGAGGWDRQDRPSEARLDRILQVRPDRIRREGAVLARKRFDRVAEELRRRHGWN